MRSNAILTPAIYTGPLSTYIGDGVTEAEGRRLFPTARVMLGKLLSAADAGGQQTASSWHTFDGITVRVGRFGGQHVAEFVRHNEVSLLDPGRYDAFTLAPYGGVIVDGYIIDEPVTDAPDSPTVVLLDRFTPANRTLKRLSSIREALEAALESETDPVRVQELTSRLKYLHGPSDYGLKPVPYLPLVVPDPWKHLYNNPVRTALPIAPKVYSQYRLVKPTMYSGRMRVVAQILAGMGRQAPPTKAQQLAIRGDNADEHVAVEDYRYDAVDPERSKDDGYLGSLNYWFLWIKTHGVYKSPGGRYYLIQISGDGVWAMRLPVLAMSSWAVPEGAKEYIDDLPLGFAFPTTQKLPTEKRSPWDQAVKEGWVKRIITAEDMAPFYGRLQATYLECGWAFSMSGRKADNVGWRLNAPRPHDYPVFEHWSIEIGGGDAGPTSYRYDYDHQLGGYDRSIEDLRATITPVGKGVAVDISQYHKPFKVPTVDEDTGVPGVISFDMLPRGWPRKGPPPPDYMKAYPSYPVSDVVVHVFYDEEELVWIRFYNPMNTAKTESDSWDDRDFPPHCMVLGGFSWGSYTRPTTFPKGFYSNRVDPRKKADESSTDLQSQGRKIWESPYMGVQYSWPYPPFHFGYEQSNVEGEWYNSFDPSYTSRVGSPWTAKRHAFHVHVHGTQVTGQSYNYACALPLTDREAAFICERHTAAVKNKIDYQYAAMIMQWVYYTYPSWTPDYDTWSKGIIPVGDWEWWQLRDDTVKYTVWQAFSEEQNYTKEEREEAQTVLNIVGGEHTAPVISWDRGVKQLNVEDYDITTICSSLGGEYPKQMRASGGASVLWEEILPQEDGIQIAHLWCTRSVVGNEASKMHIYLNGMMEYTGLRSDKLTDFDEISPHRQTTFIGET